MHLSIEAKQQFIAWFLGQHLTSAKNTFNPITLSSDSHGYAIEMQLSLGWKLANFLTRKKNTLVWDLNSSEPNSQLEIKNLSILEGESGILIGLNVVGEPTHEDKYFSSSRTTSFLNNKRLILTDSIVKDLLAVDLNLPDYAHILSTPHQYSIIVSEFHNLLEAMGGYRDKLNQNPKSRSRSKLKQKLAETVMNVEALEKKFREEQYKWLLRRDDLSLFFRPYNGAIIIVEKRPQLDTMVFSGGLANSYAQIGAFQAIEEAGIKPNKFAGSSFGAVIALFCYLGYSAKESLYFFNELRRLARADTRSLKIAIDFFIIKKLNKLMDDHNSRHSSENFAYHSLLNNGKISFASLRALKERLPLCDFGEELIITSTDIKHKKTQSFSYSSTPHAEVSKAVALAANFPIPFKSTVFDEEVFPDEEILSYLPIDLLKKRSTLLETEESNSLTLVAFQVENKTNFELFSKIGFLKDFWSLLKDSNMLLQRANLEQHNHHVFVFPINTQISTKADISKDLQQSLVQSGREAGRNYLEGRYQAIENNLNRNELYSYSTFFSIEELLYFCCYRRRFDWFEFFVEHSEDLGLSQAALEKLNRYRGNSSALSFRNRTEVRDEDAETCSYQQLKENMHIFEAVFPLLIKFPNYFVNDAFDLKIYNAAINVFSFEDPLSILAILKNIKGEVHLLVPILITFLEAISKDSSLYKQNCESLAVILKHLEESPNKFSHPCFRANWSFSSDEMHKIIIQLRNGEWQLLKIICELKKAELEPKKANKKSLPKKNESGKQENTQASDLEGQINAAEEGLGLNSW